MLTLYSNQGSGNCYKVRLLLHLLGYEFEIKEIDTVAGDTRTEAFRAINPVGKVPTLVLDDGTVLSESNAMLLHFSRDTQYMPFDELDQTFAHQWLFWEQYSHETAIAVARYSMHYLENTAESDPRLPDLWAKGYEALRVMENHLAERDYFVANQFSIADIALYAYTHMADEGGFDLTAYPHVVSWLERCRTQPRFKSIHEV